MRDFSDIFSIAAERKGGDAAVEAVLTKPKSDSVLAKIPDDRWLSSMAKCIFQAGFSWKVVEAKWPGFEAAFHGFDVARCADMNDMDMMDLTADKRIIRNGQKISAVQQNAVFLSELIKQHGRAGAFFTAWPHEDYVGLLAVLKTRGARLGGITGARVLRDMGVDSFILTKDVTARLIAEGIIDKPPTSKTAMEAVQSAFNIWHTQSARSFTEISRVLAMSVG